MTPQDKVPSGVKLINYYRLKRLSSVVIGSFIIVFGIHLFILPHHIIEGGMLGIGLLTSYITPIPSGVAILLLSLPIYIFTWFYKKSLFWFNMLGVIFISFLLEVIPDFEPPFHIPPLLSAWLGGVMIGTGIGVLLRSHITTDGLDLLAHLLSFKTNMNVGILIFFLDMLVIFGGMFVLNKTQIVLSLITISGIGIMTTLVTWSKRH
ncbi:YitT family protein [Paenibacillus pinihumi]|uniref:YitT family protein n=1 Tax=Paenibacillus pinihumi TaxID=669462 RepID=UPI000683DAD9|nr:YitT family protein [Paenibacillus pinihumi]